jgi:predicted Fe-S protein YdhL (DUF1289 family)
MWFRQEVQAMSWQVELIMTDSIESIVSPCIGVCAMNQTSGLCEGCFRSIEEIRNWWDMSAEQRAEVMAKLDERQATLLDFD